MRYALITLSVVEQIQPYHQDGFVEVPDDVVCGMVANKDGTFSAPAIDWLKREREQMIVTPYQARQALLDRGLLDQVETMMADPTTSTEVRLMWEHKQHIRRLHPVTNQMLDALGMTEEQKDDLFRYGMSIEP